MDGLARFAPLSGLIAAVLFGVGNAIWGFEQPPRDAGTEELVSFYTETSTEILIGGSLSLVSLPFFVWFGSVLRDRLIEAEGGRETGLPLVAFAGTLMAAAVGSGAETINMAGALSSDDGQLTGEGAHTFFDISYSLGAPAAGVALAMVAAPTAIVALRTGEPLRPVSAWLSLVLAVGFLSPAMLFPVFGWLFAAGILGLAALSIHLYRDRPA